MKKTNLCVWAFSTKDRHSSKLTSYKFTAEDVTVFIDFGSENITDEDLKDVDIIFITHEHLDHWGRLIHLHNALNPKCKIVATATTQEILKRLIELNAWENQKYHVNQLQELINKIESYSFFKEYSLSKHVSVRLFPSGHTFGSAMVYLNCESYSMLFTGDMDFNKKALNRQYEFPCDLRIDYLFIDSTHFLNKDFKKDFVRNKVERTIKHRNIMYYSRPEKAVALAFELARMPKLEEYKIHYSADLKWYLKILTDRGYNPFLNNKVQLAIPDRLDDKSKIITITSQKKFQHLNAEYTLGLHLSYEDTLEFISQYANEAQVYLTHYDLKDQNQYITVAQQHGFHCLAEGLNAL